MDLMIWFRVRLLVLVPIFAFHGICYSEKAPYNSFMKEATSAPVISSFDYIIVGGGTSGCSLAATLSQNASVLLLERGGSPYDISKMTDISNFATTISDTSPTSPSQLFISEDGVYNTRARVLGGGTVLNAGFYTRASDEYVKEIGWDDGLVKSSYEWVEKKVAFKPPMLQWQSAVRDGLLEVGVSPDNGFSYDHMYGTKFGGTIFDRDGHRHTAADLLEYANPKGVLVLLHATVNRIMFTTTATMTSGRLRQRQRANGVIFKDANGVTHIAELSRYSSMNEIIISAGAVGSPQILMLSGVGPSNHLRSHGINVVMDQPMVGQGMSDNPMNAIFIPSPLPVEVSLIQVVGITSFDSYIEAASGLSFTYSWARRLFQELRTLFNQTELTMPVPSGAMASMVEAMDPLLNASIRGGVILEKIMGPASTGHLELRTTDPNDNPSITFNYFEEAEDLRRCVQGMTTIINVINSKAFSKFRYTNISTQGLLRLMLTLPLNLRPRHISATVSLEQFCRDTVMTIWHYHGGCQVGRVVDHDYRVLGVDALRVIDGSTFYQSPGTNPQATVMMLGRYMGQIILQERESKGRT